VSKHSKELRRLNASRQREQFNPTGFQITASAAHFSGPIPPPEILIRYNEASPGAADRIIAMAENQSQHRQELEKKVIETNCRTQKTGPMFGFVICMTAILGGIYLIHDGKSGQGLAAIIAALTSLAVVFVVGKKKQERELAQKANTLVPNQPPPKG
jgi:uncharacterized membrane protein